MFFLLNCKTIENNRHSALTQKDYAIGNINIENIENPEDTWFSNGYNDYITEKSLIKNITPLLEDIEVKVFIGTWCPDTKRLLPKLYKVLDEAGYERDRIFLYGLNKEKKSPKKLEQAYQIKYVPTILFFSEGNELNRIVEIPIESIEKDILKILRRKDYTPLYSKS